MALGSDGALYGTTSIGGAHGGGTVFKVNRVGTLKTIYDFCSEPNCTDGESPWAGLFLGSDASFYGTTISGGASNTGTIFRVTSAGQLTTLHSFCDPDCSGGSYPYGGLLQATNGIFYGTTYAGTPGGDCYYLGCGTIYSLDTGLGPFVTFVRPAGKSGQTGGILGQGFTGTTSVAINGIQTHFAVVSDTYIKATVPPGATTGYVTVTTPTGVLTSNVPLRVIH